jgi:drug/metabolite transporter (DMT)-like permease
MTPPKGWINWPGAPLALGSAALFGASTPFAKLLLGEISPWLLAGLLYLGSGLGLTAFYYARKVAGISSAEASLSRGDLPWLGLTILSGGIVAPVLLMLGLSQTPASSAALLLNLEGVATMVIAWLVFRENTDRRILIGAGAILAGAILLSWSGGPATIGRGAIFIAGACVAWGIDNNLTRKISNADPVQIAGAKGLVAGLTNIALAFTAGALFPSAAVFAESAVIGFLGYGVSLVLFVLALRHLGSARTGAYFSTAPFIGAVFAVALFAEPVTGRLILAAVLMALGLWLHLTEAHEHEHSHTAQWHEHSHIHDEHHHHKHEPNDPAEEPHSHWHRHEPLTHRHPHFPDMHHRHEH